jgi:hypothetical protein
MLEGTHAWGRSVGRGSYIRDGGVRSPPIACIGSSLPIKLAHTAIERPESDQCPKLVNYVKIIGPRYLYTNKREQARPKWLPARLVTYKFTL